MKIIVWGKPGCSTCEKAKDILNERRMDYEVLKPFSSSENVLSRDVVKQFAAQKKLLPVIWIDGQFVHPKRLGEFLDS